MFRTSQEADPKLRFMYIVKWYLSSFHTGRKGAIAKKPFNPVLGEVFRCHWELPTSIPPLFSLNLLPGSTNLSNSKEVDQNESNESLSDAEDIDKRLVETGPVPWSNAKDATFVAEQVSHHPPSQSQCHLFSADGLLASLSLLSFQFRHFTLSASAEKSK